MDIRPIRNDRDHREALAEIDRLMDEDTRSSNDKLEVLATLVASYEAGRWPIALPTPAATLKFVMEQRGLKPKDLQKAIGSQSKVSEVLSGTRTLSLPMIVSLHREFGIPERLLIDHSVRRKTRGVARRRPAAAQRVSRRRRR